MISFLDELNPQQREAVTHGGGPVLVIAGAGSGKTRVITCRLMYLFQQGVSPYQMLAMTFTNKAALEMKHRAAVGLGAAVRDLTVTTFHSFCARFLRSEIGYLERDSNFVIFDAHDQVSCLRRIIRGLDLAEKNFPAAQFRNRFSFLKNTGDWNVEPETDLEREIFLAYRTELKRQNALDFDDLLLFSCRILAEFPECRERYRKRFRNIMVDEYQDTNKVQARLVNLLLNEDHNVCVVGDEDQSIYGWRGADIRNILDFELHYPETKIIKLEQNYRSTQRILDYANQVISANQMRKPKKLWTSSNSGNPIIVRDERSGASEAEFIVQTIQELREGGRLDYADFAVLFRSNYLSRNLEEMFRRYRVPYQLIGGLKFYDRKEIKDLLAYMRIVVNPRDWTSLVRALGVPSRGIGAKSQDKLYRLFARGEDIPTLLDHGIKEKLIPTRGLKGLKEFRDLYTTLSEAAETLTPRQWLELAIDCLDYRNYLEKTDDASADYRVDNIEELLAGMAELEAQGVSTLSQFMDFSSLVSDQDEFDETEPRVSLMTVHAAKGLEFHAVFVMGLEEGVFPNQRALVDNPNAIEEERRLFYVAVTRAKQRLFLTYTRQRQTFGTITKNPKSRFLLAPGTEFDENAGRGTSALGAPKPNPNMKIAELSSQIERMKQQLKDHNVDVCFGDLEKTPFKSGDLVKHPKFGTGTVSMVRGTGDLQTVKVYFPGRGVKTLVAKMAKLEKILAG